MLLGMIADTNAQWLTQRLADIGIDIFWISQVGDNLERVTEVFTRGLSRSDVVIVTGGLGPTEDDLTREAIAATFGETMAVDPVLEQELRDLFKRRGRPMPERNVKQATLIPSGIALRNPIGTAPGWWAEREGHIITAMPGVPAEMRLMWEEQVRPRLKKRSGSGVLVSTFLKALGLGESAVEEQLGDLIHNTNPTVATYAKPDGVQIRVSAKANDDDTARALLAPTVAQIMQVLGPWIYGRDDETLAAGAAKLLAARNWTITSAEVGTAGSLSGDLSADAGLSARYLGGYVLGSSGAPLDVDTTDPIALARAARERSGADVAIGALVLVEGGTPRAAYAVDVQGSRVTEPMRFNLALPELRRRVSVEAMALLVRTLRESPS
jgi:nicotinamide-nucleotide amidase